MGQNTLVRTEGVARPLIPDSLHGRPSEGEAQAKGSMGECLVEAQSNIPPSFPLLHKVKKQPKPRGDSEDTVSCKTHALNIRAIKLVKLKAILENRKGNIYVSGP